ncbi:hypothetical protein [Oceanibium sediminis]|uniref:hypothetical protein n=1 Tax=Oceanibium sediminis TaxID=2026339 RepID=UPI000DD47562|nr:hypothetical protein [Oceanibium sediminis]
MSFIRPEVRAALSRNRPRLLWSAAIAFAVWVLWRGLATGGWLLTLAGGAALGLIATFLLAERQRGRFRRATAEPGIVKVDEAQIAYFGPDTGGIVDLDALNRVELISSGDGIAHWRLHHEAGPPVAVPLAAEGAEQLVDVLMTLPGVNITAALAALDRRRMSIVPVWSRKAPPGLPRRPPGNR